MSKHPMVKKIILDVNGKELSLSVEDARGLLTALEEVLGKKEVRVVGQPYPVPVTTPYVTYYPWITYSTTNTAGYSTTQTLNCSSPTACLSS